VDVLTDLSDDALARAAEENQWEVSRRVADLPDGEVHDDPDLFWHSSGIPVAFLNGVLRARFDADDVDARIERALDPFRSRGVPATWVVGPASTPADLGRRLIEHGLTPDEVTSAMACDLAALPGAADLAAELEVRPVEDEATLETFLEVSAAAYGAEPPMVDAIRQWYRALGLGRPELVRVYVAYRDGEAAGGSSVFYGAGVVGLYGVGTAPEARGHGVGRAVSLVPLLDARERGYRAGVLTTSEMGMSVYRRLGFREVCSLDQYAFSPSG
jgi:GNAT superfamily N-acetyltransferase